MLLYAAIIIALAAVIGSIIFWFTNNPKGEYTHGIQEEDSRTDPSPSVGSSVYADNDGIGEFSSLEEGADPRA
jgi:hypothetical protein